MRVDRLRHMADFLEFKLPKQSEKCLFDICYVAVGGLVQTYKNDPTLPLARYECKSHGCIMGWTPVAFPNSEIRYVGETSFDVAVDLPDGEEITSYDYVGRIFYGVSESEADYLFSPGAYFTGWDEPGQRTDQSEAISRLRQVANHWEQTGKHYTQDECWSMTDDSKGKNEEEYYRLRKELEKEETNESETGD